MSKQLRDLLAERDRMLAAELAGVDLDSPLRTAGDRLAGLMSDFLDPIDFATAVGINLDDEDGEQLAEIGIGALAVDAAESAGWRPPARVIETPEELDTLPNGTVILDDNDEFHRLNPYGMDEDRTWFPAWLSGNASAQDFGQTPQLPARVVHLPAEEDDRA